jgi:hypothetical protein
VRYADDWLAGFSGPRREAEEITREIGTFLRAPLKLELSETNTWITHTRTHASRVLGYGIVGLNNHQQLDRRGHRSPTGQSGLRVPKAVIQPKGPRSLGHGKPIPRAALIHDTPFSLVAPYQQESRGLVADYRLADNRHQLHRLKWVMARSLVQTRAPGSGSRSWSSERMPGSP